jgi:hypothetical protein
MARFGTARQVRLTQGTAGMFGRGGARSGMAWQGRHGFYLERILRRKKWKLKMYVGVIGSRAMGLIQ